MTGSITAKTASGFRMGGRGTSRSQIPLGTRFLRGQRVWKGQPLGGPLAGEMSPSSTMWFLDDTGVGNRDGREKCLGIGVVRRREYLVCGALLDDVAEIHDHHTVGGSACRMFR